MFQDLSRAKVAISVESLVYQFIGWLVDLLIVPSFWIAMYMKPLLTKKQYSILTLPLITNLC